MDKVALKDSGHRQKFKTGAQRDIQYGKGFFSCLPASSIFLVSRIFEDGAMKYGKNNWQKGIPIQRYISSALSHIFKYMDGLRDEPHLPMAAWNILCAIWTAVEVDRKHLPNELNESSNHPLSPYERKSLKYWYSI